jgi:EAL domain-containing protein (putative c-di-GMP-specific phosphodiesterase class I)
MGQVPRSIDDPLVDPGRREERADDATGAHHHLGHPSAPRPLTGTLAEVVDQVIDGRRVQTLFQPLVHLATDEIVGYEALGRGPQASPLASPLTLLAAARSAGRLAELDWVLAASAYRAAAQVALHPSMSLFINFEAATLLTACPADLLHQIRHAEDHLRVLVTIDEAQLRSEPGRVFDALAEAREIGWGVALHNVEAGPASLALLPLAHPDVIELDLRRMKGDPVGFVERGDGARMYAEETGASVLVSGIEVPDDLQLARSIGAQYGEGRYFGGPADLPSYRTVPRAVFPLLSPPAPHTKETPFEIVRERCATAIVERRFLEPLVSYLGEQVDHNGPRALFLACFPNGRAVPAGSYARLRELFGRAAFSVGFGPSLERIDTAYLRTGELALIDPMGAEWDVIVVGAHYCGALVAREVGDEGAPESRRVEYALTHDHDLVLAAARSFLRRVGTGAASPAR